MKRCELLINGPGNFLVPVPQGRRPGVRTHHVEVGTPIGISQVGALTFDIDRRAMLLNISCPGKWKHAMRKRRLHQLLCCAWLHHCCHWIHSPNSNSDGRNASGHRNIAITGLPN